MNRSITVLALGALLFGCRASTESAPTSAEGGSTPTTVATAAPAADEWVDPRSLLPPEAPFEGEIVLVVSEDATGKLPAKFAYDIKGNHARLAGSGSAVRVVADLDTQKAYAIDVVHKVIDTVDLTPTGALPKIQKTGRKETVLTFECEHWTIDAGSETVDACVAPGMAFFGFDPALAPGHVETSWAAALTAERAFPFRAVVRDKSGKTKYRFDASHIFRVPANMENFNVPTTLAAGDLSKDEKAIALP